MVRDPHGFWGACRAVVHHPDGDRQCQRREGIGGYCWQHQREEDVPVKIEDRERYCAWCGAEADPAVLPAGGMGWCGKPCRSGDDD